MGDKPSGGNYYLTPIQRVQKMVCEEFGVTRSILVGERRDRQTTQVRHICFWLCKKLTNASYPNIGSMFNHRDHTTIIFGVRKAPDIIRSNEDLRQKTDRVIGLWEKQFHQTDEINNQTDKTYQRNPDENAASFLSNLVCSLLVFDHGRKQQVMKK